MMAMRTERMTNIRLYRISKEMCPHHPEPPTLKVDHPRLLQFYKY